MNKFITILLCCFAWMCHNGAFAINTSEDIDQTILNLYEELQSNQKLADQEIATLQNSRSQYWEHIVELQKETDKAALVLYSQDGGSLFSIGLASEALSNVCNSFNKEKVPFQNWLQAMTVLSNRHANIKKALTRIHTQHLQPKTLEYIKKSITICDSLDQRFTALRDSIQLDQQRYERLSTEIHRLEEINRGVINQIRTQIFQNDAGDMVTFFSSFNYSDVDLYYDDILNASDKALDTASVENRVDNWEGQNSLIALILFIVLGVTLRFALPKKNAYRSKRWYYALLLFIGIQIIGTYIMPFAIGINSYMSHIQDVYADLHFFMFWMVLSAIIRLNRPGLGWSIAAYAPLFFLGCYLIFLATELTRNESLKTMMTIIFLFIAILAIVIIAIGAKRFLKADYLAIFSCMGLIFLGTVLVLIGYYYPAFILMLFFMSLMTYISALVCIKHFLAKRIERSGKILHLTLSHLIYPLFYIYALVQSLYEVADVFNLHTWLADQIDTPFIDIPQYGVISASSIIMLIVVGIIVNYLIKLIRLILMRINKEKYETGVYAVGITLGTMATWAAFCIFALMSLHINHSGVIAAIGGASLGIGFALKETLENLISGLQLMASRARPGDLIECDGARGVIKHIGILSTQLQLEDGPIVSIPNRQLLGSTFTNLTLNNRREIRHIIFDISADSDLIKAKDLMLDASRGVDGVVDHDKHYVVMRNTNSGIVRLDYKCWIDSAKYLKAEPAVREAIFRAFRANGIEIANLPAELGLHLTSTIITK